MKRVITAITGGLILGFAGYSPVIAQAATETPACGMPTGWFANADEQDRLPTPGTGGLKFVGNDLIHHDTDTTVENLTHGTYVADPSPAQPSFFSVEVSGTDGGYGTLRWDTNLSVWTLVTGGQYYENTSPAALVDMPPVHRSHKVVRFGVGFTANPADTTAGVTVSSVSFAGKAYDLTCKPPVTSASPSPSKTTVSPKPSTTTTKTASPSASSSSAAAVPTGTTAEPGLPLTGPNIGVIAGAGAVLGLLGLALLMTVSRRRRTRFTA